MLTVERLTKTYRGHNAVRDLSFTVPDGQVTGFLGPNGSGKSTTMRMCVGLETPTSGTATFDGQAFRGLRHPSRVVGTLLDATWFHPGRTARAHLAAMAALAGLPTSRVDEVLDRVGILQVAQRKVGGYSLGMKQRLGLACALLGDPAHILLDEPVNGLDPEGVHWMRDQIRQFAAEGRAVLVSSHLLSEMALTADRLVVIGRGELIGSGTVEEFVGAAGSGTVEAEVSDPTTLVAALAGQGIAAEREGDTVTVTDTAVTTTLIGELCLDHRIVIRSLTRATPSLEEAFLGATADAVEYRAV
ncbi:ATP-binding cassette domain-containing protein [Corynebacterium halotolerans]|uniref:ABC transporter ATP-binding protein n=1 Tax=Corynebacterium halotolerans YIM 70093 = DSM 44683 TaxID=1121362 RepID=M1NYZ9_9CORY|nr:ATP-binding cassette domain-containing protein [Corynebacterium halotolerans]AGF72740.1 ABC transporter ATP-binding protein [Corynebacterium halotolerans YIM 70093 = DSM 44683]